VDERQRVGMRVGDAEREQAIAALGEHMSLGRLTVDEYGERAGDAAAAKTRAELLEPFADLPEPRPHFDTHPAPSEAATRRHEPGAWRQPAVLGALLALVVLAAVVLFAVTGHAGFFFLILGPFWIGRRSWMHPHGHRE
jgi:hypothetical protein